MRMLRSRRKVVVAGLVVLGAALIGWGCRPKQGSSTDLQLWTLQLAPKFNTYMEGVIKNWQQNHPSALVRWTDLPWGSVERKLLAAVFARTAPDVVNLNPPFAANLASKGGIRDLTPLLPDDAAAVSYTHLTLPTPPYV